MSRIKAKLLSEIIASCQSFISSGVHGAQEKLYGLIEHMSSIQDVTNVYTDYMHWKAIESVFNLADKLPAEIDRTQSLEEFEDFLVVLEGNEYKPDKMYEEAYRLSLVILSWNKAIVEANPEPVDTTQPYDQALSEVQTPESDGMGGL